MGSGLADRVGQQSATFGHPARLPEFSRKTATDFKAQKSGHSTTKQTFRTFVKINIDYLSQGGSAAANWLANYSA